MGCGELPVEGARMGPVGGVVARGVVPVEGAPAGMRGGGVCAGSGLAAGAGGESRRMALLALSRICWSWSLTGWCWWRAWREGGVAGVALAIAAGVAPACGIGVHPVRVSPCGRPVAAGTVGALAGTKFVGLWVGVCCCAGTCQMA